MKCAVCDEEFKEDDNKFMLPLERPYMNIFMHRGCYLSIVGNISEWINEYLILIESQKKSEKTTQKHK